MILSALALTAALSAAHAQDSSGVYYLESPTVRARAELTELLAVAEEEAWSARVVRRYELGEGWTYTMVVEDFDDAESARAAAARFAAAGERGVAVYRRQGRAGVRLEADWPSGEGTALAGDLPTTEEVLLRAVRALGGQEGGTIRLEAAPAMLFRFERELTHDGEVLRARHELLRSGDSLRLNVEVLEGQGQSSLTIITPEAAWLRAGGKDSERDRARAIEIVDAFTPDQLLSYPLRFAELVEHDPGHHALRPVMRRASSEGPCLLLENTNGLGLCIDEQTWRPVEVSFTGEAGLVRYHYSDWREVDTGLVLPFEVMMERDGEVIEALRVLEFNLPDEVNPSLFVLEPAG